MANLALDHGNPNLSNIRKDFERFGPALRLDEADVANIAHLAKLSLLNEWRNIAAHHRILPPAGLPAQSEIQGWQAACDGLATSLDEILYNNLTAILGIAPWVA